jgi:hypothetical protein
MKKSEEGRVKSEEWKGKREERKEKKSLGLAERRICGILPEKSKTGSRYR